MDASSSRTIWRCITGALHRQSPSFILGCFHAEPKLHPRLFSRRAAEAESRRVFLIKQLQTTSNGFKQQINFVRGVAVANASAVAVLCGSAALRLCVKTAYDQAGVGVKPACDEADGYFVTS